MAQSIYVVCHIAVTTVTGIGGITTLGTGRCCNNTGVLMCMSLRCDFDNIALGNRVNMNIDHRASELGVIDHINAAISNVYAIAEHS